MTRHCQTAQPVNENNILAMHFPFSTLPSFVFFSCHFSLYSDTRHTNFADVFSPFLPYHQRTNTHLSAIIKQLLPMPRLSNVFRPKSLLQRQATQIRSFSQTMPPFKPALTLDTINPSVLAVQYAVRGELAIKADQYVQVLADKNHKPLPFEKVVTANIGNPQQKGLDQVPLTYWRQVISLLEYPDLMQKHEHLARQIYPGDVIERARALYAEIGSVGAYTHSKGVLGIRKRVAKFIEGEFLDFSNYSDTF